MDGIDPPIHLSHHNPNWVPKNWEPKLGTAKNLDYQWFNGTQKKPVKKSVPSRTGNRKNLDYQWFEPSVPRFPVIFQKSKNFFKRSENDYHSHSENKILGGGKLHQNWEPIVQTIDNQQFNGSQFHWEPYWEPFLKTGNRWEPLENQGFYGSQFLILDTQTLVKHYLTTSQTDKFLPMKGLTKALTHLIKFEHEIAKSKTKFLQKAGLPIDPQLANTLFLLLGYNFLLKMPKSLTIPRGLNHKYPNQPVKMPKSSFGHFLIYSVQTIDSQRFG